MSLNQYPEWVKYNELNVVQSQEIIALKDRIKRLEEAGDAMVNEGWNEPHLANAWRKAKEAKL